MSKNFEELVKKYIGKTPNTMSIDFYDDVRAEAENHGVNRNMLENRLSELDNNAIMMNDGTLPVDDEGMYDLDDVPLTREGLEYLVGIRDRLN